MLPTPPNSLRSLSLSLDPEDTVQQERLELGNKLFKTDLCESLYDQEEGIWHCSCCKNFELPRQPALTFGVYVYVISTIYLVLQIVLFVAYTTTIDWRTTTKSFRMSMQMVRPGPNFTVILLQVVFALPGMLRRSPLRGWLGDQITPHYIWCLAATIMVNLVVSLASLAWGDRWMGWDQGDVGGTASGPQTGLARVVIPRSDL